MIKLAGFLGALLILSSGFAQDLTFGNALKTKHAFGEYVGTIDGVHVVTSFFKNKRYLNKISEDMNLSATVEMELMQGKDEMTMEDIGIFNEQIVMLVAYQDNKAKTTTYYLQEVDAGSLRKIGSLQEVGSVEFEKRRSTGYGDLIASRSDEKLLIYLKLPYEKGSPERFRFQVWDNELNMLWREDYQLPYADDLFRLQRIRVGNNGNVYITGTEWKEKRERRENKRDVDYKYHIMAISDNGNQVKDYDVSLGEQFISDMQILIDDKNDLLVSGFYGEKSSARTKGMFYLKIDSKSKDIAKDRRVEFPEDFILDQMSDKAKAKAKKKADRKGEEVQLVSYDVREMLLKDDGGFVVLAEQYRFWTTTTTTTNSNGASTTKTTYHYMYNDLIVLNVSPDGEIEWYTRVPKHQYSTNDGGYRSSYTLGVAGTKILVVYNDAVENLNFEKVADMRNFRTGKDGGIVLATIDGSGNVKRKLLYTYMKKDDVFIPKESDQVDKDEIFMYMRGRKGWKFASLNW